VRFGRPEKEVPQNFAELIKKWEKGEMQTEKVLEICKIGRTTLYAKLKEYKAKCGK